MVVSFLPLLCMASLTAPLSIVGRTVPKALADEWRARPSSVSWNPHDWVMKYCRDWHKPVSSLIGVRSGGQMGADGWKLGGREQFID